MHVDANKLLWDAQHAADRVSRFTAGKTFDDYLADELLRSAVERQLGIVGEALSQLRRIDPATAGAISQIARVIGFRNILVHGYATLDHRVVWGVIERDLDSLRKQVTQLLGSS
jgi:uncharacterized protein with HEPN domain